MKINKLISKYNFYKGNNRAIRYIVIHYVGGISTAEANAKYFAGGNRNNSAHYFVCWNGDIWQSVEDCDSAWHCGAKSYKHPECRNNNSIGIELCCKKDGNKWYFEDATVLAAAELTKELMAKYNIPASNVLRHYDVTGKVCPEPFVTNLTKHTWDEFKQLLQCKTVTANPITDIPKPSNIETVIWKFFRTKGLNPYATAGLMGNLYAESGLNSRNLQNCYNTKLKMTDDEYTNKVDSEEYKNFVRDSAGYGLAQWTYWSRKQNLYDYCKKAGKSIGDLDTQLEFLWNELQGYKAVFRVLSTATSVKEASDAVLTGFEKPADQSDAVKIKRANYGIGYYNKFVK